MNEETNLTMAVVTAWLTSQGFTPPPEAMASGETVVRSTDNICDELADIADLDPNEVAAVMLEKGFALTFPKSGRHGWVLYR